MTASLHILGMGSESIIGTSVCLVSRLFSCGLACVDIYFFDLWRAFIFEFSNAAIGGLNIPDIIVLRYEVKTALFD